MTASSPYDPQIPVIAVVSYEYIFGVLSRPMFCTVLVDLVVFDTPICFIESSSIIQQLTLLIPFSFTRTDLSYNIIRSAHSISQYFMNIILH